MSSPDETVELPPSALVECPLVGFNLRPLARCPECPKFGGLEDRFPNGKMAFQHRYVLRCFGEPVKRAIRVVAEG